MRRSIHEPRKNGPDSNVRALADRWKSDAERYRKYAETGPNPALHQAIAQTLINAADELNGALAQDHRARLLREVEAEWNQLQANAEWSQLQAEAQAEWNDPPAEDADGFDSRHP